MRAYVPPELRPEEAKVIITFPSMGINDRGKTIEEIVKTRKPIGLFNTTTGIATNLTTGRQIQVGTTRDNVGGLTLEGWAFDLNEVHILYLRDVSAALAFLKERFPNFHYMPTEYYESRALLQ